MSAAEIAAIAAIAAALIGLVGTLASLALQRRAAREDREEARRMTAKAVLDRYRGPLVQAASDLGARVRAIREKRFDSGGPPDGRNADRPKLTTAFRFAEYYGWRELLRTDVQLLRFESDQATRLVSDLLNDVRWVMASDRLGDGPLRLWVEEQRAIGELMLRRDDRPRTLGYAAFTRAYDDVFAEWIDAATTEMLADEPRAGDRLRLLQWALAGLVMELTEEREYEAPTWIESTLEEFRTDTSQEVTPVGHSVRGHLETVIERRAARLARARAPRVMS